MTKASPDFVKTLPDGRVEIALHTGVEIDGAATTALTMREPTVDDQITASEMSGSDAVIEVTMFANLCEVPPEALRRLTMRDYKRVQAAYQGFTDSPVKELRAGVLALARATGWSWGDIGAMPTGRFMWWLDGVPDRWL